VRVYLWEVHATYQRLGAGPYSDELPQDIHVVSRDAVRAIARAKEWCVGDSSRTFTAVSVVRGVQITAISPEVAG
jgi:hypothetical protein